MYSTPSRPIWCWRLGTWATTDHGWQAFATSTNRQRAQDGLLMQSLPALPARLRRRLSVPALAVPIRVLSKVHGLSTPSFPISLKSSRWVTSTVRITTGFKRLLHRETFTGLAWLRATLTRTPWTRLEQIGISVRVRACLPIAPTPIENMRAAISTYVIVSLFP